MRHLQDFESVRKAAAEIKSKYEKLYCLSLNAGIMATPDKATKDGYFVAEFVSLELFWEDENFTAKV